MKRVTELARTNGEEQMPKVGPAQQSKCAPSMRRRHFELAGQIEDWIGQLCPLSPLRRWNNTRADAAQVDAPDQLPATGAGANSRTS